LSVRCLEMSPEFAALVLVGKRLHLTSGAHVGRDDRVL
jgi:hypothetical protein